MKQPSEFGRRLRELRLWLRLRPEDLAERAGVHPILIRKYENGYARDPKLSTAVKIARALGVKLDRLADCE